MDENTQTTPSFFDRIETLIRNNAAGLQMEIGISVNPKIDLPALEIIRALSDNGYKFGDALRILNSAIFWAELLGSVKKFDTEFTNMKPMPDGEEAR